MYIVQGVIKHFAIACMLLGVSGIETLNELTISSAITNWYTSTKILVHDISMQKSDVLNLVAMKGQHPPASY